MTEPTTDLLGALGIRPDQVEARRRRAERAHAVRASPYVYTEDVLRRAHRMHMEGLSVRRVAWELFEECFSATPGVLASAFCEAFKARGWEIRSPTTTKETNA